MKLAVFPKCYIEAISDGRMPLSKWIEMASTLPVDGIEMYDRFLASHEPVYLRQVKQEAESRNLRIPMMCYSPDFVTADTSKWKDEVARQKEVIAVTAELGGKYCRILSGQQNPAVSVDEGICLVVNAIRECLPVAEEHGIVLVMENHYKDGYWQYPEFAQKGEIFLAIIKQVGSPYFGVQYDPSNSIVAGEDPLVLLDKIKHRVRTMHASDRFLMPGTTLDELKQADGTIGYSPKLCHGVIGRGLNDYDAIFRTLKEVGFDGWVSIEDGMNGMDELRESAEFLRVKMAQYGTTVSADK